MLSLQWRCAVSGSRLTLLLLQIVAGVGLAAWLRRELYASSARQPLPPRTVAVARAGALVIVAALAATAAFRREELGTGLLLLIGAGAVLAAALRCGTAEPTLWHACGRWRVGGHRARPGTVVTFKESARRRARPRRAAPRTAADVAAAPTVRSSRDGHDHLP
jgi:hypothetical protein